MRALETRLVKLERAITALDGDWVAVARAPIPANDDELSAWAASVADALGYTRDIVLLIEPGETLELLAPNQPIGRMSDPDFDLIARHLNSESAAIMAKIEGGQISAARIANLYERGEL